MNSQSSDPETLLSAIHEPLPVEQKLSQPSKSLKKNRKPKEIQPPQQQPPKEAAVPAAGADVQHQLILPENAGIMPPAFVQVAEAPAIHKMIPPPSLLAPMMNHSGSSSSSNSRSSSSSSSSSSSRGSSRKGQELVRYGWDDIFTALKIYRELFVSEKDKNSPWTVTQRFVIKHGMTEFPESTWGLKLGLTACSIRNKQYYKEKHAELDTICFDHSTVRRYSFSWEDILLAFNRYKVNDR